jgi:hypothetical protein
LLKRFSSDPEVQKAAAEFDHAQKLEETFLKDFERQDFTKPLLYDVYLKSLSRDPSVAGEVPPPGG